MRVDHTASILAPDSIKIADSTLRSTVAGRCRLPSQAPRAPPKPAAASHHGRAGGSTGIADHAPASAAAEFRRLKAAVSRDNLDEMRATI